MSLPEELLEATIGNGRNLIVSDVETNGLLPGMSGGGDLPPMDTMHCATVEDVTNGKSLEWTPDNIRQYPEYLMDTAGVIIGHNFINFDIRAIAFWCEKNGIKFDPSRFVILDSLVMCKMIWPADVLIGPDMKLYHKGVMPGQLLKRHSLAAWGCRLGNNKGDYKGGWDKWSPSMQSYMVQDGKVNLDLWKLIVKRFGWDAGTGTTDTTSGSASSRASSQSSSGSRTSTYRWPYFPVWIEMEMAKIISAQEEIGVGFDYAKATAMAQDLKNRQGDMTATLRKVFPKWWQPVDNPIKGRAINRDVVKKCKQYPPLTGDMIEWNRERYKALTGKVMPKKDAEWVREYQWAGSTHCRITYTEFNPNSRDHLADRLQRVFGWKPDTFTPSGKPQVDENVIESLPSKVVSAATRAALLDYFVVTKTNGQLNDGAKSWIDCVSPLDGAIHGRCDPLGTITHRGTHYGPNLGQIPAVEVDDDGKVIYGIEGRFGAECRELFIPGGLMPNCLPDRKQMVEMTGSDIHSLEFVMLGHELERYDGGEFRDRASDPDGDLHEEHAERATAAGMPMARRAAKTLGFLIIYGGGALKAGKGVGVEEDEIGILLQDRGLPNRLRFMKKRMGRAYEEPTDLDKARIVKGARGIKAIKDAIPGLEQLMDDTKQFAEEHGYVIAIDGRKLITRKAYSALNTKLQGGGSVACKLWQILFHKKMLAAGFKLRVHYNQVLWVHDETQNEHKKGLGETIGRLQEEAAAEASVMLKLKGTLRTESKTGKSWKDCH